MRLFLFVFLAGCGQVFTLPKTTPCLEIPNKDTFLQEYVWNGVFNEQQPPPPVTWVQGESLNCGENDAFLFNGKCVLGEFLYLRYEVLIAVTPTTRCSDTSYVHEMTHAYLYLHKQEGNLDHTNPAFAPDGLVLQVNRELKRMGY